MTSHYFMVPANGPNGTTDFDQMFNELRAAGYTFWFDVGRDRDEQEKIEQYISSRAQLPGTRTACFKYSNSEFEGWDIDAGDNYRLNGYVEVPYQNVLVFGITNSSLLYNINLPAGYSVNSAAVDWGQPSGDVSASFLQAPYYSCTSHNFVETGTARSWCSKCNTDATWDRDICGWVVK